MAERPDEAVAEAGEPAHAHERRDIDVAGVGVFLLVGVALIAVTLGAMVPVFGWLRATGPQPREPVWEIVEPTPAPPEPRLQTAPSRDLRELQAEERRRLTSWEWVRPDDVARIPIERAMELVAAEGLPHRAPEPEDEPEDEPDADGEGR